MAGDSLLGTGVLHRVEWGRARREDELALPLPLKVAVRLLWPPSLQSFALIKASCSEEGSSCTHSLLNLMGLRTQQQERVMPNSKECFLKVGVADHRIC